MDFGGVNEHNQNCRFWQVVLKSLDDLVWLEPLLRLLEIKTGPCGGVAVRPHVDNSNRTMNWLSVELDMAKKDTLIAFAKLTKLRIAGMYPATATEFEPAKKG